jgi:hypothetical protein
VQRPIRTPPFLVLALVLALSCSSCSETGYQKFKEHGAAATTAATGGMLSVVVGGPAGIPIFAGSVFLAMLIDAELAPPEKVKERVYVIQTPTPAKDGTPGRPRVDTFDTSETGKKGNLELPPPDVKGLPAQAVEGFFSRSLELVRLAGWLLAAAFLLGWVINHPTAQVALRALAGWAWNAARARAQQAWALLVSLAKPSSMHAQPGATVAPPTATARAPSAAPTRDNGPAEG